MRQGPDTHPCQHERWELITLESARLFIGDCKVMAKQEAKLRKRAVVESVSIVPVVFPLLPAFSLKALQFSSLFYIVPRCRPACIVYQGYEYVVNVLVLLFEGIDR